VGERLHESFNGKLRDELLNVEIFDTLWETQVFVEWWRKYYKRCSTAQLTWVSPSCPGGAPALGSGPAATAIQDCLTGR
jgi:hypothetical protein